MNTYPEKRMMHKHTGKVSNLQGILMPERRVNISLDCLCYSDQKTASESGLQMALLFPERGWVSDKNRGRHQMKHTFPNFLTNISGMWIRTTVRLDDFCMCELILWPPAIMGFQKIQTWIFLLVKKGYDLIRGSVRFKGFSSMDLKSNDYVCSYIVLKYPMLILKEACVYVCVLFQQICTI